MSSLALDWKITGDTSNGGDTTDGTVWVGDGWPFPRGFNERDKLMWVVGFMDGEGCFKGITDARYRRISPRVTVGQTETNVEVLWRVSEVLGGAMYFDTARSDRAKGINSRDKYQLEWYGDRARRVGNLLYPWLGADKRSAIELWDTPNPRYGDTNRRKRTKWDGDDPV